ncbi:acylphosphatase [Sulfobacillus thermosulfidooxidans]|uniref:acylphosphatase n=1 Tax=Sulfobacillus thermosulfidooxidans TaxID=28034 RepID=UPI00048F0CCB|nr:acylphosphatase [Sulfobacillus thermosulfidooxidans]
MSIKRYRVTVVGRVQGVGFRQSAWEVAQRYHISGWVRNCSDPSRVQLEIEGEQEQVSSFIEWLQHGPTFARVDHVYHEEMPVQGSSQFEIRR